MFSSNGAIDLSLPLDYTRGDSHHLSIELQEFTRFFAVQLRLIASRAVRSRVPIECINRHLE
ncbi:hypothetical protein PMAYCL1PPCAC_20393, partial [Pristionchus mayeri]